MSITAFEWLDIEDILFTFEKWLNPKGIVDDQPSFIELKISCSIRENVVLLV